MSACSEFVEHIWKPGSCQNCFCPRHVHQLQALPLDLVNGGLSQALHGTQAKLELLEDEGVTSLPYSKPTIAVKPTMINADLSEVWSDGNLCADLLQQVGRSSAPGKHALMKSGEDQKAYMDSFNNHVLRKRVVQNSLSDCAARSPQIPPLVGSSSPASKAERNKTCPGDMDVPQERTVVPGKERLPLPRMGLHHKPSLFNDRPLNSTVNSVGYPSAQQIGEVFPSEKKGVSNSPILENEGGEYCSIVDCCRDPLLHQILGNTGTPPARPDNENHVPFWGQDGTVSPKTKSQVVNFGEEESRVSESALDFQRETHTHDSIYSRLRSETERSALPAGPAGRNVSPVRLCQGNYCCPLDGTSGQMEDKLTEDVNTPAGQPLASPVGLSQNEPIYAESTKRKKVQLGNASTSPISNALANNPCKDQAGCHGRERTQRLSSEQEFQDSAAHVAATITIMAAHTENDNRTIFLSSPDSAVGVQWPCVSPTSHPEAVKTPSFFERIKGPQENNEMPLGRSGPTLQTRGAVENMADEGPAVPPKLSKGSPLGNEVSVVLPGTSPGAGTCDSSEHEDGDDVRNETDSAVLGASSPLRVNSVSSEDPNRGLSSSSSERRQKYYNLPWSRQCRIEEEEGDEEQGLLEDTKETEVGNGNASPPGHREWGTCSAPENKTGGMSKSASFAFEFPKDKNGIDDFAPPPPPPKKLFRHFLKMNKSNPDLEKLSSDYAENHSPPFQASHVTFTAGSADSLHSDTNACNNGGQPGKAGLHSATCTENHLFLPARVPTCPGQDRLHCIPLQPPPLPQKKTVSRAVSSPDGFYWGPDSPARAATPRISRLNYSQSENKVCSREESLFGSSLGIAHKTFSSSESLEKAFKGSHPLFPLPGKNSNPCCTQNRNLPPRSSSQQVMPSGSSLQLHNLLSNIDNKEGVYAKLGGLYAESLRRLVAKCEDCFMRGQKSELHFNENNWSLFKLTCNKACCDSGDAIYYCATCAKDPSSTYAVKICKSQDTKTAASCCSPSVPVHFNIQQDCGHFVASVPSSMLRNASADGQCPPRAASEQDCVVVITREVPHQTAADFVQETVTFHKVKPEWYERRVCFLLLQLCNGLEHLKEHNIIHRDLCLENLLLVHCNASPSCNRAKEDKCLPRLIISNFLKAKQKSGTAESKAKKNQARLAPEIVSASQYKKFDEFQTGILIYELLHQLNPFEVKAQLREQEYSTDDLPPLPNLSIYSRGLQQLALLLLEADPIKRIRIAEAKRILQCLLWGPRKDLTEQPLNHQEALHDALHNWVDMKRALLMMKFAERAVDAERSIELEDWLCCQYLASAEPSSLSRSLKLLQLL